jgi:hypothetical protein
MSLTVFQELCTSLGRRELNYNSSSEMITVTCADKSDLEILKAKLSELGITTEELYDNQIEFQTYNLPFKLFWDLKTFRKKMLLDKKPQFEEEFSKDFAVIKPEFSSFGNNIFYKSDTQQTFIDFNLVENLFFFSNAKNYVNFLHFLKSREHKEDGFFHFVDYFSWDNQIIVFVSATKEGKLSVPFYSEIPNFDAETDLTERFERFFEAFDDNDKKQKLPKFIKAELFNFLSKEPKEKRIKILVDRLKEILNVAEQNFDIYLYDLSLENLKKDYLESKDKYFGQLREILGKITAQIIALPISISAVALATYNIPTAQNKETVIFILVGAFMIYSLFAVFLLKLYREDVADIEHQYERDFQNIENSDFFRKYGENKDYFVEVKQRVTRKINTMKITIFVYFFLLTITNSVLIWKLLSDISFYPLISLVFWLVQAFLFWFLYTEDINNKSKSEKQN